MDKTSKEDKKLIQFFIQNQKEELYLLLIDGRPYGKGSLKYINELLTDHLLIHDLYGKKEVSFCIKKLEKEQKQDSRFN